MTFQIHSQLKEDSYLVGYFKLCQLRLIDDSQYPWFILLPQIADIEQIHQLNEAQRTLLWQESHQLSLRLMTLYQPDKLNVAAIGNLVPQLHLHHVVRFKQDQCWPKPIWGQCPMKPYLTVERETLIAKLQQGLLGKDFCAANV